MDNSIPLVHCNKCNQDKLKTDFYHYKGGPRAGMLQQPCKECTKASRNAKYIPKGTQPPPPPPGHKRCSRCRQTFEATTEFFYSNKNRPDGLNYLCKPCHHEYEQSRFARLKQTLSETQVCHKCGKEKPATVEYFHADRSFVSGLKSACKECSSIENREYYHTHPEFRRHLREYERNLPLEKKEAKRAYAREWEHLNRERKNARARAYRKTEKSKASRRVEVRNRYARKKQAQGSYTAQQIKEQYARQKNRCYWCKTNLIKEIRTPHIDHIIPLSRGGSNYIDNIVIACHRCNESRNNRLPHEWDKWGRLF